MTQQPDVGAVSDKKSDRRSSVRASSLLPCSLERIDEEEVPAVEARILDLAVVEGAGHLFEGPGELEDVADHAAEWFATHLG